MHLRKSKRFDKVGLGFLIGFAVPLIVFFTVYLFRNAEVGFVEFAQSLWRLNVLVKLGSLCVFLNSAVFMGFIYLKHEKTARGILGATILYALVVLISRGF